MTGWHHDKANWKPKECKFCGATFVPHSGVHIYCSSNCRGRWRMNNVNDTTMQYQHISGNWARYFSRLCQPKNRKGVITPSDCEEILARQQGLCALTGEVLTCSLAKGVVAPTNASLDRVVAGGTYTASNVQLVCAVVNKWRGASVIDDYISWCRKVVEHADQKTQFPAGV